MFNLVPSDFISANEIVAASFPSTEPVVNTQQQKRQSWPAEPAVALAYVDQLTRAGVLAAASEDELRAVLADVGAALSRRNGDASSAAQLEALAGRMQQAGAQSSGVSARRYQGLALTLEGIAARLR